MNEVPHDRSSLTGLFANVQLQGSKVKVTVAYVIKTSHLASMFAWALGALKAQCLARQRKSKLSIKIQNKYVLYNRLGAWTAT